MKATRTTNPLHFEDLEPHRFEDLVRQLAYRFRDWESLEAVGRTGADEGVDILGRERPPERISTGEDEDPDDGLSPYLPPRIWIIQCKRERTIGPTKVVRYVQESLLGKDNVYGYILAAASDFSLKARAAARSEAAAHDVPVTHVWGKAELEDMLFVPENDHLLFAYFGISLQVRRRSQRTQLSTQIAVKRKLVKIVPLRERSHRPVLLRDPRIHDYPFINDITRFREAPRWRYFEPTGHLPKDHLQFLARETGGWFNPDTGEWDMPAPKPLLPANGSLFGLPDDYWNRERDEFKIVLARVPENRAATIQIFRYLSYDRILAVDDIGDAFNEPPHLLVEYDDTWGFFEPEWVTAVAKLTEYDHNELDPDKRIDFF